MRHEGDNLQCTLVLTWYKIQQKQIEIQQFVCEVIEAQEDASLLSTTQTLGKQLFTQNCIACHTKTGANQIVACLYLLTLVLFLP